MEHIHYFFSKLFEISGLGNLTIKTIVLFLSITIVVFLLELFIVGWQKSSIKRILKFDKTVQSDLICWFLEIFNLMNFLAFLVTLGTIYYLSGVVQRNLQFDLLAFTKNYYIQFIILFVVGDFKNYWYHAVFHKFNPLWEIHEFHHSATCLTITTTFRDNFMQIAIGKVFDVILFVLLGTPTFVYVFISALSSAHKMLIHSSIQSDWGFIGKYILVSPAAHRLHHSIHEKHYNKNLGSTLIIWDRIFKTYHPAEEITEIGIPNNNYNQKGFISDIYFGLKKAFNSLFHASK